MKEIFSRPAKPDEVAQAIQWATVTNPLAARGVGHVYCGYNGKPRAYLTALNAVVLEDFTPDPEAGELERAAAARSLIHGLVAIAAERGVDEVFFFGGQGGIGELALRHGFELVEHPMYSLKLR